MHNEMFLHPVVQALLSPFWCLRTANRAIDKRIILFGPIAKGWPCHRVLHHKWPRGPCLSTIHMTV
jgi:hypothetical protein